MGQRRCVRGEAGGHLSPGNLQHPHSAPNHLQYTGPRTPKTTESIHEIHLFNSSQKWDLLKAILSPNLGTYGYGGAEPRLHLQ